MTHIEDKDLVAGLSTPEAPLRAAAYARRDTAVGVSRWLGPLGNYLIARPAARAAAHKDTERTDLPLDAAVVLGLSDDALHVWSADPMLSQVHDHLGSVELARIAGMRYETGKSWSPVTISFTDTADEVTLEARGDAGGLVRAFEEVRRNAAPPA